MIAVVFCGDLKYCPYLGRYIERLENNKEDYIVLFWNRGAFKLALPDNYKWFDSPSPEDLSKKKKIVDFLKFRNWLKSAIAKYNPDRLILLSTLSGMIMADIIKKYKGKYIFDIRDYSYESNSLFYNIERKIIENSFFTAISSKGFKAFLPKYNYVIAHNFNRKDISGKKRFIRHGKPIKLVWNGTIRFFDYQKNYIDALKNDERFVMVYHGIGTDLEKYKEYCDKNDIKNVIFTGAYDNKDKEKLLYDADFLNNCYGGRYGDELKYAVSNRYYDGLIYKIPQLVEPGGFKAEITESSGVGIALEADESFADKLYDYYNSINDEEFDMNCERQLKTILSEDDIYINQIDKFISF